jgi:hypothetical protein
MLRSKRFVVGGLCAVAVAVALGFGRAAVEAQKKGRAHTLGTVYVTSQEMYYDTFVTAEELPPHGPFQLLVNGQTEFGPGDPGYLGGRWKVPNPDSETGYDYLLCPLLGPGRANP